VGTGQSSHLLIWIDDNHIDPVASLNPVAA
jgi:hypothetical protein